jgi:hypothetical protein
MFATALLYWELYVDLDSKPDAESKQANTLNGHPVGRVHDEQDFQVKVEPSQTSCNLEQPLL